MPKSVLKLQSLAGLPTADDLLRALNMAQNEPGRTIQLPWFSDAKNKQYTLAVVCSSYAAHPTWELSSGFAPRADVIWTHNSGDVGLIMNLVSSEETGSTSESGEFARFAAASKPSLKDWNTATETPAVEMRAHDDGGKRPRSGGLNLSGDLRDIETDGLFQSVALNKMTGRLSMTSLVETIDIFFEEGTPTHAHGVDSIGDACILEVMTWDSGRFQFFPNERCSTGGTVKKKLEGLLMEGATLADHHRKLIRSGVSMDSYLHCKFPLNEQQFKEKLNSNPLDIVKQFGLYKEIDNKSTLLAILRRRPMPKPAWIPVLSTLIENGLIVVSDRPSQEARQAAVEQIDINEATLQQANESLTRADTHLMSYPVFLHFLNAEFERAQQTRLPFAILVFEASVCYPQDMVPLSSASIAQMAASIREIQRPFDIVAHYRTLEYAMLLPHTDVAGASLFAKQVLMRLLNTPFSELKEKQGAELFVTIGIAGIPEDCQDLGTLLGAATEAKNQAFQRKVPIVAFRTLYG